MFQFSAKEILMENGPNEPTYSLERYRINKNEADALFQHVRTFTYHVRPTIVDAAYPSHVNRNVALFSNVAKSYPISRLSNFVIPAQPLTPLLQSLLDAVNLQLKEGYNSIIANQYLNGQDRIGPHSDNPSGNGLKGVATISLGATRDYQITRASTNEVVVNIPMHHGDILVMCDDFQIVFKHGVPPDQLCTKERISLTFRRIVTEVMCQTCTKCKQDTYSKTQLCPKCDASETYYCSYCGFRAIGFHPCVVCHEETIAQSSVCVSCKAKQLFWCSKCGRRTDAPWPCDACYYESKKKMKHQ